MYATTVGRTFLTAYNRKYEKDYTAKTFFEEVFVPLFFDHTKYMMTAGNSPLENSFETVPKRSATKDMIKGKISFETPERRKERINRMIEKIESERADASIAIGYGVLNNESPTSGQITNIEFPDNKEDIYLSWIGAGLGIGVVGGLTILFDQEELLLDIYEGWQFYRDYLEKNLHLKGNQIDNWNGHWIVNQYSNLDFDKSDPTSGLNPMSLENEGLFHVKALSWVDVTIGIALHFPVDNLIGYLYSIGKSNTTVGFIPFILKDIIKPIQLYAKVFGSTVYTQDERAMKQLLGTALGLKEACRVGAVGIPSMKPKGLETYIPFVKSGKKKSLKEQEELRIIFNTYLIWILAMLNNEKLWDASCKIAELLTRYKSNAEKARTDRILDVENLLDSISAERFIFNLIPIIDKGEDKDGFSDIGKLVLSIPRDNFRLFSTLIKFQCAIINNKK